MCFGSAPTIKTTARDLVPSTNTAEPDSPVYGSEDALAAAKKKKGKSSLQIDRTGDYKSLNT